MIALLQVAWRVCLLVGRIVLFLLLFLIAITNTAVVDFHWFLDQSIQVPLNILLLAAFLSGLILALLALRFTKSKRIY
jgi:uncharacterized integral membrane protein